jgi:cysteine sulfinate desulfinase/cysteine desulfurase-like protein
MLGSERGGAVRFSLGWCSTADDIRRTVAAVAAIVASARASIRA